tara:strand:+ start:307 stop:1089 length:783 start_codon:yes stop_codon:yes gene_type:complete
MEPAKTFNNVIIGQFALTDVPLKAYVNGRALTITGVEDVEDPNLGFGMDENGQMHHFNYSQVEKLIVAGNDVNIAAYNTGMEAKFKGGEVEPAAEEEPKEDDKESEKLPKESIMNLQDLLKEISQDEVDAEVEGAKAAMDAAKAKLKASQAAMKTTMKTSKEKIKAAKSQPIDDGVVKEDGGYTFGTGDIIKNINPKCKHFGSQGIVKGVQDLPGVGSVAIYTVTNTGETYKPGDSLTKTIDQLAPIQAPDDLELTELYI